jgi:hypothetical protein
MLTVSLRDEVQKALATEWKTFAQRHPRLAAVIDQNVLMEQAVASLADDPEFREAMEGAAAAGLAAGVVVDTVRRYVMEFLRRLV